MPRLPRNARYVLVVSTSVIGGLCLLFVAAVIGKVAIKPLAAEAATSILAPKSCLGGWSNPNNATGPGTLSDADPATAYNADNSAFLASAVSSQIFCGYFDTDPHAHAPTRVTVKFRWATKQIQVPVEESLSSSSGTVIATSTGLSPVSTSTPPAPAPQAPATPDLAPASGSAPTSTEATSSAPAQPAPAPDASSTPPAAASMPEAPSAPEASTSPAGFIWESLLGLAAETAHAAGPDAPQSANPFLQISYSTDGVRWTVIGTVGSDNFAGYQVDIPVASWADVASLQIMVSVLPNVDKKPDIYLESMSANIDYNRTLGEVVSDSVDAAADALDAAVAKVLPKDEPQAPREVAITKKKLVFSEGRGSVQTPYAPHTDIKAHVSSDGSSLTVSGRCSSKYYVILVFRNLSDFALRPTSALVNGAWECENGSFSYDASTLSADLKSGRYYIVTGEEEDTGPWKLASHVFPVDILATTTTEVIQQ